MEVKEQVHKILTEEFTPDELSIVDHSKAHAHHASSGGAAHLEVKIVSNKFAELPMIKRHRMIYQALDHLMQKEIHALSINAKHPGE